jgi:hypothetical protein
VKSRWSNLAVRERRDVDSVGAFDGLYHEWAVPTRRRVLSIEADLRLLAGWGGSWTHFPLRRRRKSDRRGRAVVINGTDSKRHGPDALIWPGALVEATKRLRPVARGP